MRLGGIMPNQREFKLELIVSPERLQKEINKMKLILEDSIRRDYAKKGNKNYSPKLYKRIRS